MDPKGMQELFPDWRERGCPVESPVTFDCVDYLKANGRRVRFQGAFVPPETVRVEETTLGGAVARIVLGTSVLANVRVDAAEIKGRKPARK